ncbi:MAG: hypothetical protein OXI50_04170 [Gammaproteobacteria bacterium]|nr:hypothetical protein [Gammaproteobacteria bacterium]
MARHADPGPTGGAVVGRDGRRPMTVPRPSAGLRALLMAAIVAAAVGVGLWASQGSASAQAPAANAITTELRPGWNVIGWLGSDTTVADLFRAIPALELVAAWDAEAGRYAWGRRDGKTPSSLEQLPRGQGLYLRLAGTETVQWTRPAADGVVLLRLHAGHNLVTWGGPDGMPVEEALDWLGDAVVGASRWNADTRESERYRPGASAAANTLRTLNHGDALWVRLSEDASWWQSGTAGTEFVFEEPLRPAAEAALRAEVASVLAFFYEHYGLEPVDLVVNTVRDLSTGANAWVGEITVGRRIYDTPQPDFPIAHEYFHVLQFHWAETPTNFFELPNWLVEGTAVYAEDVYEGQRLGWTGDRTRAHWWQWSTALGLESVPLDHWVFDHGGRGDGRVRVGYDVGALATDWVVRRAAALSTGGRFEPLESPELVARADHDAHMEFFRLLPESASWEAAFATAFGIAVDDFYEAFGEYRTALAAQYLPHLADDRDEPQLLVLGEIPSDTRTLLRAQFDTAQEIFRDRFASGPVDYTVFVAADQRSSADYTVLVAAEQRSAKMMRAHFGGAPESALTGGICQLTITGFFLSLTLANCEGEQLADLLGGYHFDTVLSRLLPAERFIRALPGYEPPGPHWLQLATRGYAVSAYRDAVGIGTLDEARRARAQIARGMAEPLSSLTALSDPGPLPDEAAEAVSFLAGDWLVARAGEPAIFEYYRLLESTGSWQQAFQSAFGITIDDFYREFAAHRAAIAPPEAPEEPDGPRLVLLGEFDSWLKATLPARFEAVQAFYGDRLGGEPVDYTVYIAATPRVAAEHRDAVGDDVGGGGFWKICWSLPRDWEGPLVIVASCAGLTRTTEVLGWFHYEQVLRELTPPDPWPDSHSLHMLRGCYWLDLGLREYAERTFFDSLELEDLDRLRPGLAARASRAEGTLSDFEHYPPGPYWSRAVPDRDAEVLSFLAAELLVARAGERAIYEYYRLRQSAANWQDAFEAAFGITIDDFYQEFAAYRAAGFES